MREMKNSGIEWIGDIPSDWKICRFRNIVNIYNGNSIKDEEKANYEDAVDAIPYIATKDVDAIFKTINYNNGMYVKTEDKSFKRAPCNSVLLCIEGGSAGKKIAFTNQEVCFINKLCCFYSNIVNNKFLFYYMQSPSFTEEFKNHISGLIGGVSISEIKGFSFVFAPIEEQEKIVTYLDEKCVEIDTVIEKTKATIEEYKKLKQSVITQAVTKGIRPNRPMKDSGIEWIGKIPVDWSVRKLKTFTTQISKGATPKDMSTEKTDFYSIRFLKSENIVDNQLMSVPEFYIEESIHSGELKRSQLSDNDIMFVIAGASIGKVAIVSNELLPANTNQAMSFIRVLEKYKEIKKYLWYVLQSDIMKLFITLYSVQSAQPNISMENLGNFRLCVPADFQEIKDILLYLNIKCLEIDELITKKTSLLSELENYKKSLIYEYVTGKKEV